MSNPYKTKTGTYENEAFASAFPVLNSEQIEQLRTFGTEKHIGKDQEVWKAGEPNLCMYVVLRGELSVRDSRTKEEIAKHIPGGFSGDIAILSGQPALTAYGYASSDLDVLEIDADGVRRIVAQWPVLGQIILEAYLRRRALLMDEGTKGRMIGLLVMGSRFSRETLRIREFLWRNTIPH